MKVLQTPFLLLIVAADGEKKNLRIFPWTLDFIFWVHKWSLKWSILFFIFCLFFLLPRGASFYILTRWADDFSCIIGFNEGFLLISMWNAWILLLSGVVRGVKRTNTPLTTTLCTFAFLRWGAKTVDGWVGKARGQASNCGSNVPISPWWKRKKTRELSSSLHCGTWNPGWLVKTRFCSFYDLRNHVSFCFCSL